MVSFLVDHEAEHEQVTPTIQAHWLHNGQLIVYDVWADVDSDFIVNTLYDHVEVVVRDWNPDQPFLTLWHHHDIMPMWSPVQNERLLQLKNLAQEHFDSGRAAVILPRTPLTMIIQLVLRTIKVGGIEIREFSSYDKAVAWLEELLN